MLHKYAKYSEITLGLHCARSCDAIGSSGSPISTSRLFGAQIKSSLLGWMKKLLSLKATFSFSSCQPAAGLRSRCPRFNVFRLHLYANPRGAILQTIPPIPIANSD
jgi:hypothetical protein